MKHTKTIHDTDDYSKQAMFNNRLGSDAGLKAPHMDHSKLSMLNNRSSSDAGLKAPHKEHSKPSMFSNRSSSDAGLKAPHTTDHSKQAMLNKRASSDAGLKAPHKTKPIMDTETMDDSDTDSDNEQFFYNIFGSDPYAYIPTANLQPDPDIAIISGSADDLPPQAIRYTRKRLIRNRSEFDICHYFNNNEHVYSIRHDKRKRVRFEQKSHAPPKPAPFTPFSQTRMKTIYTDYIENHVGIKHIGVPLNHKSREQEYGRLQQEYFCKTPIVEDYFTYPQEFPCFSFGRLRRVKNTYETEDEDEDEEEEESELCETFMSQTSKYLILTKLIIRSYATKGYCMDS